MIARLAAAIQEIDPDATSTEVADVLWLAGFLTPPTPDTRPLGERKNIAAVTQSQIAATVAALLGEDYNAAEPRAGKPIADVLP